ncbi:MAG: DUF3253 domain-containing protein [Pseudomonadota bacterium]
MSVDNSRIENEIMDLLVARGVAKSICPSEVARALSDDWRALMPEVRAVARDLRDRGQLEITQKGVSLLSDDWRGPVRLRLPRA